MPNYDIIPLATDLLDYTCHYWAELVRPVRQKAFNWKRNDSNRAAALREARANQELAKMGQMAQQIAEALARNP